MRREGMVTKEVVLSLETVNGAATVTSEAIRAGYGENFSLIVKLSGTTPIVTVYYDITNSDSAAPGDVCANFDSGSEWVCPDTNGTIKSAATATFADGFSPAVSKWLRFRVTGVGANGADTKVTVILQYWS
jgi:hypothetical protein